MAGERWTIDPLGDTFVFPAPLSPLEVAGTEARRHGLNLLEIEAGSPEQKIPPAGVQPPMVLGDEFFGDRQVRLKARVFEPADPAATNLFLNPSFELAPAGWTVVAGAPTILQSSAQAKVGDYSGRVTFPAAADLALGGHTWGAGQRVDCGFWLLADTDTIGETVKVLLYNGTSGAAMGQVVVTITASWQWVTITGANVAATANGYLWFGAGGGSGNAVGSFFVDGITMVAGGPSDGSAVRNGFDGDSPGCAWTGTRHASTSTRPGPGDRFQAILTDLERKCQKLTREGGVLRRTIPQGDSIYFDVLEATLDVPADRAFGLYSRAEVTLTFRCRPFFRRDTTLLSDHVETTLPVLKFTETLIPGTVPALVKAVVDNDEASDQALLIWGMRSWSYDSAATAALWYEAEGRTLQGASTLVVSADASGAGSNAVQSALLAPSWLSILSTQTTGAGAHLSHIGAYEVWARVKRTGAAGDIGVRLEWGQGDYRTRITNESITLPDTMPPDWILLPLGTVSVDRVVQGTQRWEGRIVANSTVAGTDRLLVDWVMFVPTERGGIASAVQVKDSPTSFTARDEFDQAAGALAAKTLPVGGTWALSQGTGDFQVASGAATRTALSDAIAAVATPSGSAATAGFVAQVDVKTSAYVSSGGTLLGLAGRWVDASNHFAVAMSPTSQRDDVYLTVLIRLAGAQTSLFVLRERHKIKKKKKKKQKKGTINTDVWYTIRLMIDTTGRWFVWWYPQGQEVTDPTLSGRHSELGAGSSLDDGRVGIYDKHASATASSRSYDNFFLAPLVSDAAICASQSLEIRHDRVIREDAAGALWTPVSDYQGDYFYAPPSQPEARTMECIFKTSRNDPDLLAVDTSVADDLSARLTIAPRGIHVPEP